MFIIFTLKPQRGFRLVYLYLRNDAEEEARFVYGSVASSLNYFHPSIHPSIHRTAPEPRVGTPERYSGDPEGCNPFLTNCSFLFALQPYTFASEAARVAFTINHLTGRECLWGTAEWERGTPASSSFQAFSAELCKVFVAVSLGLDATGELMSLKQGSRPIADYAIDFRTRAPV
ncbi:hypothetical protein D4764_04G0010210 [Takifugu flavidus]|uniref:Retrotransposon gag domain-containing protein n=1 Tax=Takifugu flavidus TaxID=433684 RepID=A0A5C6N4I5_9TELE|nr:hypothetical protein D4764_04G0010210 [Takifugu flavidus]